MKKIFIGVAIGAAVLIAGVMIGTSPSEKEVAPSISQETRQESAPAANKTQAKPQSQTQTQLPARVFAADDFSNVAPSSPSVPVYDKCTLSERRAAGLTTTLPDIAPYRAGKTVYLTFDDGPDDKNTPAVLDILKDAGVHATFYVTGAQAEAHPDVLRRIYDEGHAIGNHSYDHRYEKLYPDVSGFLAEMERTDEVIHSIIGVRPLIIRAPGGVVGNFTDAYESAIRANGYVEHDWNVSSADAAPNHPVAQDFIDNISYGIDQEAALRTAIILMHSSEGHEETVKALPKIIEILKDKGYAFGVVTPMTPQPW